MVPTVVVFSSVVVVVVDVVGFSVGVGVGGLVGVGVTASGVLLSTLSVTGAGVISTDHVIGKVNLFPSSTINSWNVLKSELKLNMF